MKKYIALFSVILVLSNVCWSATLSCSGGTVITARDGKRFCRSNLAMTWYSSHGWCYKNNGKLITEASATVKVNNVPNLRQTSVNEPPNNNASHYKFVFVNRRNTTTPYRLNFLESGQGSAVSGGGHINRVLGDAPTGVPNSYGGITDMFALCEPLDSNDTY